MITITKNGIIHKIDPEKVSRIYLYPDDSAYIFIDDREIPVSTDEALRIEMAKSKIIQGRSFYKARNPRTRNIIKSGKKKGCCKG